mgnify:CR=1 FL=1
MNPNPTTNPNPTATINPSSPAAPSGNGAKSVTVGSYTAPEFSSSDAPQLVKADDGSFAYVERKTVKAVVQIAQLDSGLRIVGGTTGIATNQKQVLAALQAAFPDCAALKKVSRPRKAKEEKDSGAAPAKGDGKASDGKPAKGDGKGKR